MIEAPALRPYQRRARAQTYAAIRTGKRAPLIVAPTGAGKTMTGASIAADAVKRGKRVNWYAHRRELLTQAKATLAMFGIAAPQVQVLSYQAACARGGVPDADVVFLDEAHHLGSHEDADWKRVVDAHAADIRIGLTATPERDDGSALAGFDALIEVAKYSELIAAGHLVPCEVKQPARELGKRELLCSPLDAYRTWADGSIAIVYGLTVEECERFAAEFIAAGVACEVVHGKLAKAERDARLERWRTGQTRVVANCGVLTEGFDFPAISTIILARKCGSAGLYIQMGGRASRPHGTKDRSLLLDLSGASFTHGSPTDDRVYSLEGVGIRRAGVEMPDVTLCVKCGLPAPCPCPPPDLSHDIVGDASQLEPYRARMRAEDGDEVRANRLAKWIAESRHRGQSPNAARFKFKHVYGRWPWVSEERAANERLAS